MEVTTENIKSIRSLISRYDDLSPLFIHRSIGYSDNLGHLFDLLESRPQYPFTWSSEKSKWVQNEDILGIDKLQEIKNELG